VTLPRREYYVYVIELDDAVGPRANLRYPSVYVGQSVVSTDERFAQHKAGYKASRHVKKHGKWLRKWLFERMNPLPTREAALAAELELARRLRQRGYTVFGGH
jgi:hypothetical protein